MPDIFHPDKTYAGGHYEQKYDTKLNNSCCHTDEIASKKISIMFFPEHFVPICLPSCHTIPLKYDTWLRS
jgi:hypothetical protein